MNKVNLDTVSEKTGGAIISPEDLNNQGLLPDSLDGLAGLLIGTGDGVTITEDEFGKVYDFGPCSWCGRGHYVAYSPNALFGICNYCGAT